jgi:hypothetical protein
MVNVVKGGGRAPPTLTSRANFTLMTECTLEISCYYSVYSVWERVVCILVLCSLATVLSYIGPCEDSNKIPEVRTSTYILHLSALNNQRQPILYVFVPLNKPYGFLM